MKGFIYKITNRKNGKFYIGSTVDISERRRTHFRQLKKGEHHCFHLQRAYEKYGKDNFELTYKEIEVSNEESLRLLEERYINYCWNSGKLYNVSKKGCGGDLISYHPKNKEFREVQKKLARDRYAKLSDEEKLKRSENLKGEKNPNYGHRWSNELRKRVSRERKEYYKTHENYIKGKTYEEIYGKEKAIELKKMISERSKLRVGKRNTFYGKHHSEKTKQILREKRLGKKNPISSKKVKFNNVVYDSATECSNKLGIPMVTVAYRARKNIYGFSYVGENDSLPQKETKKMWTLEECDRLASECKTIKELNEKYPKVLVYLRNHKNEYEEIKKKYFTYMRVYWDIDKIMELAKKYNTYREFREKEPSAYSTMNRRGWRDKVKKYYDKQEVK